MMPREKFQALTEQMFYILLCLKDECCGMDIMNRVEQLTSFYRCSIFVFSL